MSKKNNNTNTAAVKNVQDRKTVNAKIAETFEKKIKNVDQRIGKLSAKLDGKENVSKAREAFEKKLEELITKKREAFEKMMERRYGKNGKRLEDLKFEREQYVKALAIFKPEPNVKKAA